MHSFPQWCTQCKCSSYKFHNILAQIAQVFRFTSHDKIISMLTKYTTNSNQVYLRSLELLLDMCQKQTIWDPYFISHHLFPPVECRWIILLLHNPHPHIPHRHIRHHHNCHRNNALRLHIDIHTHQSIHRS